MAKPSGKRTNTATKTNAGATNSMPTFGRRTIPVRRRFPDRVRPAVPSPAQRPAAVVWIVCCVISVPSVRSPLRLPEVDGGGEAGLSGADRARDIAVKDGRGEHVQPRPARLIERRVVNDGLGRIAARQTLEHGGG